MNKEDTEKIAKVRSAGFFTKGLVYVFLGGLTFLAAFDLGGDVSSRDGVLDFLLELPLGKIIVGLTALGLFAYSLWRLYQALMNPDKSKDEENLKSGFKRVRFFYSGVLYGMIAYSFARPLISGLTGTNNSNADDSNGDEKAALWELLSSDWGKILIWVLAAIVAGQALWQFKQAYSGKFMRKIDNDPKMGKEHNFIKRSGRFGYTARGVVFGVLSFFLVQVILQHNANAYKGTEGALEYLLSFTYGPILLGAVSLGLLGYGIFNIMVAKHANLTNLE